MAEWQWEGKPKIREKRRALLPQIPPCFAMWIQHYFIIKKWRQFGTNYLVQYNKNPSTIRPTNAPLKCALYTPAFKR
jgi:hypothetical protein